MLVGFPLGERLFVRIPPLRPCWQGRGAANKQLRVWNAKDTAAAVGCTF